MKSDREVMEQRDHLEMLRRPHLWPHWPALPMKKPELLAKNFMDANALGVLTPGADGGYDVVLTDIFMINMNRPQYHYADAEAVLADGWEVD